MNFLQKHIIEIIREIIESHNYLLIDTLFRGDQKNMIIEVYIDNKSGVTTEICAELSREINDAIEKTDLISSNYRLIVSSPGVERALQFLEQYYKHIGRNFDLTIELEDGKKKVKGKLLKIENDELLFSVNKTELLIKYNSIIKANVIISF